VRGVSCKKGEYVSDWRQDPATDAQKKRLESDGIKYSSSISKGEASDLIGSTVDPEDHEILILKFFKVKGIAKMSQTDARNEIEKIFSDLSNQQKWENRPAEKSQKEIYQFFQIPIPPKLSHKDAEKAIDELFQDEEKLDAWEKHEDEIDDRGSWFEDNLEMMNDVRDLYDCKKISKKLFKQIVESLEASGMSLEQIEENEDAFFKKALEINPQLLLASASRQPKFRNESNNKPGSSMGVIMIVIIIIVILSVI
jgi:hypothetical protein